MKVIQGKKKLSCKPDIDTYKRAMKRFCESHNLMELELSIPEWYESDKDNFIKMLYLEVKLVRYGRQAAMGDIKTVSEAQSWMDLMFYITDMFSELTPREMIQMFPIDKRYDGAKWQIKDYFYTMEELSAIDMNQPLKGQIDTAKLLYDYQNMDIELLTVEIMMAMDLVRRMEGKQGVLEEFMAEHGVTPMVMHEKEGYIYDPDTGKSFPITKPKLRKPRWIKVLEGRNE